MTTLYRTILFAALACYGWYYNTSLNVDGPSSGTQAHVGLTHSSVNGGE